MHRLHANEKLDLFVVGLGRKCTRDDNHIICFMQNSSTITLHPSFCLHRFASPNKKQHRFCCFFYYSLRSISLALACPTSIAGNEDNNVPTHDHCQPLCCLLLRTDCCRLHHRNEPISWCRLEYTVIFPLLAAKLMNPLCHAGKHVELTVNRCAIINAAHHQADAGRQEQGLAVQHQADAGHEQGLAVHKPILPPITRLTPATSKVLPSII